MLHFYTLDQGTLDGDILPVKLLLNPKYYKFIHLSCLFPFYSDHLTFCIGADIQSNSVISRSFISRNRITHGPPMDPNPPTDGGNLSENLKKKFENRTNNKKVMAKSVH